MWKTQLQQAEETSGIGWLLFSADEFDWEVIKANMWEVTWVKVSIQYQVIDNGITKWDNKSQPRVKVLHIEVNKDDPTS